MSSRKILSISTPQEGWVAKYKQQDGTVDRKPVIVWAVIQDEKGDGNSLTSFCGPVGPDDDAGDTYMEHSASFSNFIGWERIEKDPILTKKKDNKITIDLDAEKLYTDGKEYRIASVSFEHGISGELTKLEYLVDFNKPIGEQ
jgi:hypothetical protein